jgi:tRNA (cytidine/uridine-2'-O-)-methyltransferase
MAIHVVLVEPEIPPNTGNVARSCVATESVLHIVKPMGFVIDDKKLKRAGLDYWPFVKLFVHESLNDFLNKYTGRTMYFVETFGEKSYSDVKFNDEDMVVFGSETTGLPKELVQQNLKNSIRIPMTENVQFRSLNLSNSVNIILFEALRQIGFPNLK